MLKWQDRPVAGRYARALFEAAMARKEVDAVRKDAARVTDVLDRSPDLDAALRHPRLPADKKWALIRDVVGPLTPVVDRLIVALLEKKRWDAWRDIRPLFDRWADEAEGILSVQVETAAPLTPDQTETTRASLEKSWRGPVRLSSRVREELVGGVVVRVGDRVWDNSIKSQLDRLREEINQ